MASLITVFSILFCCALQLDFIAAQNKLQCLTPIGAAGTCINIDQCQVLYRLLVPSITQVERELLKYSQCGYVNKTVQVCCPMKTDIKRSANFLEAPSQHPIEITKASENKLECLTPIGAAGTCINIDQCQVLYSLLVPSITKVESELLKSSQCGYVNKTVQVCCPTKSEIKRSPNLPETTSQHPIEITKASANNTSCLTPNQENATCIELQRCQQLYNSMLFVNLTEEKKQFLARSQCGYENHKVLICCPDHQQVDDRSASNNGSTTQAPPTELPTSTSILPAPPQCGVSLTNRIYGGSISGIDEFPWLAMVEYSKVNEPNGFHCGGALINDRYVITAAHCTKGRSIPQHWKLSGVRLGEYDITTNPDCEVDINGKSDCNPGYVDISVERVVAHPQFDPNSRNKQHDIALLRLATIVAFNNFIKPICLPSAANLRSEAFTGTAMDVAGWGRTEKSHSSNLKLKASVNVWSLADCRATYNAANISLERSHMCAGGVEGVDSCSGDSGGPLMVQMNTAKFNVFFVAGIVSFGPVPCGREGWPGVYTRVGSYISWIQNNVLP